MAYTDQSALAADAVFISRVKIALLTAAVAVMAEANTGAAWRTRKAYAHTCLMDPVTQGALAAQAVVTNVAITGASLDSDILFTINTLFDALAGSGLS